MFFFSRGAHRLFTAGRALPLVAPATLGLITLSPTRDPSRTEEQQKAPTPLNKEIQRVRKNDFPILEHHHGKTRVRVLKVRKDAKDPSKQDINEYTVQTTLWSPRLYEKVFTKGDNDKLVATDTQKNTVYVVAKRTKADTPEAFGLALADHFLTEYPFLTKVEIEVEQAGWARYYSGTDEMVPHDHAWLKSHDRDAAIVTKHRGDTKPPEVVSQIRNMTFLKTTQSGFEGYLKDKYTKLPDTQERCLASELSAEWHYGSMPKQSLTSRLFGSSSAPSDVDYASTRRDVKNCILRALFGPIEGGHYSPSLQTTIYDAGCLALETIPALSKIAIDTPNLHYIPAKFLASFDQPDLAFQDDVFVPTNEPSGSIYCCITRGTK